MVKSNVEEYIKFAIDKEIEAVDFFTKCSEMAVKENMKKTFREFAAEEKKHQEMLQQFNPDNIKTIEVADVEDLKIADYFEEISFDPAMSIQEIFIMAMKREDAAYKMYEILADKGHGGDPAVEKLFRFLAGEELKHKNYFQKEYDDHILKDN